MSKNRRRDAEQPRSQRALVHSMMGKVRRTFAQVERDADGGAAALISEITNGAPRRSGQPNSGDKLQREIIGDKARRAAQSGANPANAGERGNRFRHAKPSAGSVPTNVGHAVTVRSWRIACACA